MLNKLGDTDYHSEIEIKEGKYMNISFRREVTLCLNIETPVGEAKVTHTGAYGRIKFVLDNQIFTCQNPFTDYFKEVQDRREAKDIIAISEDNTRAINLKEITFNLASEKMAKLHNELFIPAHSNDRTIYWVEVNTI